MFLNRYHLLKQKFVIIHFNQTSESLSLEYYILWSVHEKSRAIGRSYFKSVGNIFYDFAV